MACYSALRPALFLLPPERAHRAAIRALQFGLAPQSTFRHPSLHSTVNGLAFANPVGLAAGFDKNAECFAGSLKAGFGFVEIGTVTPRPQPGNPTPRVFRLVEEEALINRLGFNNEGVEAAAARLSKRVRGGEWRVASEELSVASHGEPERSERGGAVAGGFLSPTRAAPNNNNIIGGNIGKNKDSTDAVADYVRAMRALYPHVDYITVNISSPNTPGLRALQAGDELRGLVGALHALRDELGGPCKPIWVKIAPDNDDAALAAIATVAREEKIDALIISNTTLGRSGVEKNLHAGEQGGLSGKPLFEKSTATLRRMYQLTEGKIPLIGVGGIASGADAYAKIRAGASLVQLYTALIYQGFGLVETIQRELVELLARDGFNNVAEAVGKG